MDWSLHEASALLSHWICVSCFWRGVVFLYWPGMSQLSTLLTVDCRRASRMILHFWISIHFIGNRFVCVWPMSDGGSSRWHPVGARLEITELTWVLSATFPFLPLPQTLFSHKKNKNHISTKVKKVKPDTVFGFDARSIIQVRKF